MKIKLAVLLMLAAFLLVSGCTERQRQGISHWKSDLIGLKRTITLYAVNGQPIKSWKGRYKVEITGGAARFLHDGKAITISGTYIVEEE